MPDSLKAASAPEREVIMKGWSYDNQKIIEKHERTIENTVSVRRAKKDVEKGEGDQLKIDHHLP